MTVSLELRPAVRTGGKEGNGTYKTERHFLDFVVEDEPLYQILSRSKNLDLISPLEIDGLSGDEPLASVKRLLLEEPADLPNNRRSLFVCPECGDLGCGAVTAVIKREGDTIVWRDFGYENTYEDEVLLDDYKDVVEMRFESKQYEKILQSAEQQLRSTFSSE